MAFDQRYLGTKTAESLCEFEPDIPGAQDQEMWRAVIEFHASMCVSGFAFANPGIGSSVVRVPVLMTTFFPRKVRVPPSVSSTSRGLRGNETSGAHHQLRATLLVRSRCKSTSFLTISRLRSRTASMLR